MFSQAPATGGPDQSSGQGTKAGSKGAGAVARALVLRADDAEREPDLSVLREFTGFIYIWRDRYRQDVEPDAQLLLVQSVPLAELLSQKGGRVG